MAVRVSVSTSMNLKAAKIVYSTGYALKCRPTQRCSNRAQPAQRRERPQGFLLQLIADILG
jgi:hypothetical protein